MRTNRRYALYGVLPIIIFFVVPNAIYIMFMQLGTAIYIAENGPFSPLDFLDAFLSVAVSTDLIIASNLAGGAVCGAVFIFWYYRLLKTRDGFAPLKLQPGFTPGNMAIGIIGIVLIAVAAEFAGGFISQFLANSFPDWANMYQDIMDTIGLDVTGQVRAPLMVLLDTCIVAPIAEEMAFRGLCMRYCLKAGMPLWGVNILSSGLFALMHANPLQICYTFLLGLVLGYLFGKTGRIWVTVVLHIVFNSVSMFFGQYIFIGDSPVSTFVIFFTSLAAIYLGIRMILRGIPSAWKGV